MRHELKIWTGYISAIVEGWKRHEIRKADRDFKVGDELLLREWDPKTEKYTGKQVLVVITYISSGDWGIPLDTVVMSIRVEKWALVNHLI